MKVYEGQRIDGATKVTVNGRLLEPRHDLRNLAATFEWGYHGAAADQLALALLADAAGDRHALQHFARYRGDYVSKFPDDGWRVTDDQIRHDLDCIRGEFA